MRIPTVQFFSKLITIFCSVAWFALGPPSLAGIDLRSNIYDLYRLGGCEEAGAITMSVFSNAYPNATEGTPTFVVVRLAHGAKLTQMLVHIDGPFSTNNPIFPAMRLEGGDPNATISAHPETVSIVRWIRGESAIWLRVIRPSQTWITDDGIQKPPSLEEGRVAWTFGQTARNSYNRDYNDFLNDRANQRPNSLLPQEQVAVSTLLGVDLRDTNLQPMPQPDSELNFDVYQAEMEFATISTTPPPENFIDAGQGVPVFYGDSTIARTFDADVYANWHNASSSTEYLCEAAAVNGLITMDGWFQIDQRGTGRWMRISLQTPEGATYGFPTGNLIQGETYIDPYNWWGNDALNTPREDYYEVLHFSAADRVNVVARAYLDGEFVITPAGERIARTVELEMSDFFSGVRTINFEMVMDYREAPVQAEITLEGGGLTVPG